MASWRRLCLYMPYFRTDRARRDAGGRPMPPDSSAVPPLVLASAAGASVQVVAVDAAAARLGLRPGSSLAEARAAAPTVEVLPHDCERDRQTLHRLAEWALRFSPLVEPFEPDALHIDITGCQRLFRSEADLAAQAVAGLRRQGFCARAAIADTVGAAYALAWSGSRSDLSAHPIIVPPGQTRAYLAPLTPAALRIEPHAAARLNAVGVRTIGELLHLPRAALPARFGFQLVRRLQQALGEVHEGVAACLPKEVLQVAQGLEEAVDVLPRLQPVVDRLLASLFDQLPPRALALRRLDCVLYHEHTPPTTLSIGLSRPSGSRAHVAKLLAQRLERQNPGIGVRGLRLVARETVCRQIAQPELFDSGEPGHERELGCLVDRLTSRLGHDALLQAELVEDHQPEAAYRWRNCDLSAAARGNQREPQPGAVATTGRLPARPVRLVARPIPIRVIALLPDGPPTWFACGGREYVVADAAGPERVETAWWRGPDVRRDYFRVTAETGHQFWLFRERKDGRWYVHGIFA